MGTPHHTHFNWNAANVAELKRLYNDGLSGAQIARALCAPSRSSVIGKLNRLGLTKAHRQMENHKLAAASVRIAARRRGPPPPTKAARAFQHGAGRDAAPMPKPARPVRMTGPLPTSLNITMWDERFKAGCCKYATSADDMPEHLFCAAPVLPGLPYCGPHASACLSGSNPRRTLARRPRSPSPPPTSLTKTPSPSISRPARHDRRAPQPHPQKVP